MESRSKPTSEPHKNKKAQKNSKTDQIYLFYKSSNSLSISAFLNKNADAIGVSESLRVVTDWILLEDWKTNHLQQFLISKWQSIKTQTFPVGFQVSMQVYALLPPDFFS